MHFSHNFFSKKKKTKNHLEIHGASHLAGDDVRDDIQGLGLGRGFEAPWGSLGMVENGTK